MKIGGLQKTSLLDYPGEISAIVWTIGCNFRCPFCYNREIVLGKVKPIPKNEIFTFLEKRKKQLDGVVITGGEPLLQDDIFDFCKKLKGMSYLVKIDTNGTFPDRLKELIEKKLIDYVAMDIKAPKDKYEKLANVKIDIETIEESIKVLQNSKIDYEFRTTFVPKFLNKNDILEIGKWLKRSRKFYLQQFKPISSMISNDLVNICPYSEEKLENTIKGIKSYFDICEVR